MSAATLKLGVVGLGRAFSLMLPTFLNDARIALVAGCDPREAARARFAADFQAPVFERVEDLARCDAVQVVYQASPHQFHAHHVKLVAAQGKHMLLEKPMAISMQECDEIVEACERHRVKLIIGHCHSFDQPYLEAQKVIASAELGRVRMLSAMNFSDFLYRPRRPEELDTRQGGGVVFSQGAHQMDVLRLLAGGEVVKVRAIMGQWDESRPTEGAYSALLCFDNGAFASASYSGYGHFDSDIWMHGFGEMGNTKNFDHYGAARKRLLSVSGDEEAALKVRATYGGPDFSLEQPPFDRSYQHFGPIIVACERGDIRPLPDGLEIYADAHKRWQPFEQPAYPRKEVIDELEQAVVFQQATLHDGIWARKTLQTCLAMLKSAQTGNDVDLTYD